MSLWYNLACYTLHSCRRWITVFGLMYEISRISWFIYFLTNAKCSNLSFYSLHCWTIFFRNVTRMFDHQPATYAIFEFWKISIIIHELQSNWSELRVWDWKYVDLMLVDHNYSICSVISKEFLVFLQILWSGGGIGWNFIWCL